MRRQEAELLVGKPVQAWTSANGIYVGELVEVIRSAKWRGKVRITGVLKVATPYEIGRLKQRRGFRPGDIIEVGGINIKPTDVTGTTYLGALQTELDSFKKMRTTAPEKDWWWIEKGILELENKIKDES